MSEHALHAPKTTTALTRRTKLMICKRKIPTLLSTSKVSVARVVRRVDAEGGEGGTCQEGQDARADLR